MIWRLPLIRHIRYIYWSYRCIRAAQTWMQCGIGLGHINESDSNYLEEIWDGTR